MSERTVRVRLEAVVGQYEAALAKAGLSTKSLAHTVEDVGLKSEGSFKKLGMGFSELGNGSAGALAAVALLGVGMLKFAKDGIDSYVELVDEVKKYKTITGASAEESSKMVAVANALGVNTDTLAGSMFRLSKNVTANSAGMQAQGIEIERTKNGQVDLTKTLLNVASAYQKVGAGTEGNKVAAAAFGQKTATAMLPILKQTTQAIKSLWAAAEEHGQIVTEADIVAVTRYHLATRELGEAWTGFEREAGKKAVPVLTQIVEGLTKGVEKVDDWTTTLQGWVSADGDVQTAEEQRAEAQQRAIDKLDEETKKVEAFTAALKVLYSSQFGVQEATDKLESHLISFADATRAAQIGGDKFATSLDAGTVQGNKNREALRGMVEEALNVAGAMKSARDANGQLVFTQDQINMAMAHFRERIIDTGNRLGYTTTQVGSYVDSLLQIPGFMDTVVTADTKQAEDALARVLSLLGAIQRTEHFTNLNVLSGRTAEPVADAGSGTSLDDAIRSRGPAATAASSSRGGGGGDSSAQAAAARREAWLKAEDEFQAARFELVDADRVASYLEALLVSP